MDRVKQHGSSRDGVTWYDMCRLVTVDDDTNQDIKEIDDIKKIDDINHIINYHRINQDKFQSKY